MNHTGKRAHLTVKSVMLFWVWHSGLRGNKGDEPINAPSEGHTEIQWVIRNASTVLAAVTRSWDRRFVSSSTGGCNYSGRSWGRDAAVRPWHGGFGDLERVGACVRGFGGLVKWMDECSPGWIKTERLQNRHVPLFREING